MFYNPVSRLSSSSTTKPELLIYANKNVFKSNETSLGSFYFKNVTNVRIICISF
jgi:hypothetical protein